MVVGVESDRAADVMRDIYRPLYLREAPVVVTDLESAEMIKYAANAFLATKITFINEIAALCEKVGADVKQVSKGMGMDKLRILFEINNKEKAEAVYNMIAV